MMMGMKSKHLFCLERSRRQLDNLKCASHRTRPFFPPGGIISDCGDHSSPIRIYYILYIPYTTQVHGMGARKAGCETSPRLDATRASTQLVLTISTERGVSS